MSRPSSIVKFIVRLAGVLVVTAGTGTPASAQAPPESRVPPAVRAAHEFLLAAYPDLMRQPLSVQVKPEGDVWLLSVAEAAPPPKPGDALVAQAPTPVLLRGTIAFDGTQRLVGYQADGPYLNDAANAVLRDRVRNHPQWIQSDADVELMRMGAQATVGQTFEPRGGRPDSAGVSRHLGTNVTTTGPAAFTLRAQAPDGSAPVVKAVWLVHAIAADPSGAAVQYQFTYEPISGRLVGVAKVGGAE